MATRIREKAKIRKETADKRPRATARYVRISSSKVKIVVDLIRGKNVDEALAILMYTPKAAAPVVEKLLLSAIANAENNLSMDRGMASCLICVMRRGMFRRILHRKAGLMRGLMPRRLALRHVRKQS